MKEGQKSRGGRRGNVFAVRIPPEQRAQLEARCAADNGPRHLGPWLVWKALQGPGGATARPALPVDARQGQLFDRLPAEPESAGALAFDVWENEGGSTAAPELERVLPAQLSPRLGSAVPGAVIPGLAARAGNTQPAERQSAHFSHVDRLIEALALEAEPPILIPSKASTSKLPPISERVILDLCAGSGAWSEPYRRAGYPVRRVTLPADDVRTFIVKGDVWGVLAAPPCTEFSLAKNGQPRDFAEGLACVNACLRIVWTSRPRWWALENPVGLLGRWLGRPHDVFEPFEFGDPWSKRTALWGVFERPRRGLRVQPIDGGGPLCSECYPDDPRVCSLSDHRARTPAGFAQAFFEANP